MRFRTMAVGVSMLAATFLFNGYADTLSDSMLKSYSETLSKNPRDYSVLYQRASQYYLMSEYESSLADILKAIEYTPKKETAQLASEYSLLCDVYQYLHRPHEALQAVDNSLKYNPSGFLQLYKKANIQYELKKWKDAYDSYSRMSELNPGSQEALFGMAKAEIMQHHREEANEILTRAAAINPGSYLTNCRVGDFYKELGEYSNATESYFKAFSSEPKKPRAIESLSEIAGIDFSVVERVFANSGNSGFDFTLGEIALKSGNYSQAFDILTQVKPSGKEMTIRLNADRAEACFYLGRFADCISLCDRLSVKNDSPDFIVLKAKAMLASGDATQALAVLQPVLEKHPDNKDALLQAALCSIALRNGEDAISALDRIIESGGGVLPVMLKAFAEFELTKNSRASVADYTRVALQPATSFPELMYKALAMAYTGDLPDAYELVTDYMKDERNRTKENCYSAAVFYSQTGALEDGIAMIEEAKELGYQNDYELYYDNISNLNISPIRHLLPPKGR